MQYSSGLFDCDDVVGSIGDDEKQQIKQFLFVYFLYQPLFAEHPTKLQSIKHHPNEKNDVNEKSTDNHKKMYSSKLKYKVLHMPSNASDSSSKSSISTNNL